MSASIKNEIEEFLNGGLVSWIESSLPRPEILSGYSSLLDGFVLHTVWLQIDPEPQHNPVKLDDLEGILLGNGRAKNFDVIVRNMKSLYEEELGYTVLMLPDCSILGHSPESRSGLEQMKLLLTLLLGAAVQCPNKELFIGRIKELNVETQHAIVELIKQVTDNQSLVLTHDSLEQLSPNQMYNHLIRVSKERDYFHANLISNLITEIESPRSNDSSTSSSLSSKISSSTNSQSSHPDSNHMAVELADLKSKLRKMRQELEEKSECYMEVKEELDHKVVQYEKLRVESQEWYTESKRASAYRDEFDVLRERADRADRLEIEIQRFREKLSDSEFYKTRVEELREDNRMLLETKEMLEEQLQRSRKRAEHAMVLETEIIKYKQKLNDMSLERDVDRTKLQELVDENTQLQLATKNLNSIDDNPNSDLDEETTSGDNSLSEQLTNNAQSRVLKLELENRRLMASLDSIKETSFHESSNKILDLEKDKKKLSLKVDQLQDNYNRMLQQNQELEDVFKNALEENKKLQDVLDVNKQTSDRQCSDRDVDRMKIIDLEKHVESLTKDKQRIQNLSESIQRRAADLERTLDTKTKESDSLRCRVDEMEVVNKEINEIKSKLSGAEKESSSLNKEVVKLRENLENKDVIIDQNTTEIETKRKEIQKLIKDIDNSTIELEKIHELEHRNQELESQTKINLETISTLQKDLITGTLATKKVKQGLEKLGLDETELDNVDLNVENVVEKLVKNPETFKTVREIMLSVGKEISSFQSSTTSDMCVLCHRQEIFTVEKNIEFSNSEILSQTEDVVSSVTAQWKEQCDQLISENLNLQQTNEQLQAEGARSKVDVSTLGSQITSLNTQHIALQLANSQLAAEKDVSVKQLEIVRQQHESLLHDQVTLQCLHDQLSSEYESLNKEKETIKLSLRDSRVENRDYREREINLKKLIDDLKEEIELMKKGSGNLSILRAEHSKLTDDFRSLFSTHERFKTEYKNVQEKYRASRKEIGQFKLQNTELTGELSNRVEQTTSLEIEMSKTQQERDMLLQMNTTLDTDRRTLMEHVAQILAQYHELLTHSLEDKQHYHDEEKLYTDKVNNLHRQKEKLEEKIMEHYRKLDSCSPKKKAFGSSFVKKVRKAGSDLINRVPSRNRRSWIDDSRLTQSQYTLGFESGGNESDNSIEEPNSVASDTTLLQRNSHLRQSLQRKPSEPFESTLTRGGARSSLQTSRRDDLNKSHRNSLHSIETPTPPDVSLNLGSAGSRRTVYLVDENKITENDGEKSPGTPTPTNNSSTAGNDQSPSTFLMYNRISTMIGEPSTASSPSEQTNGANDKKNVREKSGGKDGKESAVWPLYSENGNIVGSKSHCCNA